METEIGLWEAKRDKSPSVSPEKSNKTKEDESSVIGMWKSHWKLSSAKEINYYELLIL